MAFQETITAIDIKLTYPITQTNFDTTHRRMRSYCWMGSRTQGEPCEATWCNFIIEYSIRNLVYKLTLMHIGDYRHALLIRRIPIRSAGREKYESYSCDKPDLNLCVWNSRGIGSISQIGEKEYGTS